jgi:hypothetical protein
MIRFQTEREKWVWLACFIDTEGNLGLYKRKAGKRKIKRGFAWGPELRASSTTPILLKQMKAICKCGHVHAHNFKDEQPRKPQKQYQVSSNGLRYILPKVLPFLLVKHRQAELLLEALSLLHVGNNQWTGKPCNDERLEEIYQELRRLNKRGVKILSK